MRAAVEAFAERKFGPHGAYDPGAPGPWRDGGAVKETVAPYSAEFVDCMAEVAQYIHDKHGKFPGARSTIMLPGFVQAHHLDTDFYDTHYQEGAYLLARGTPRPLARQRIEPGQHRWDRPSP